jgi:hypothetical protein
VSGSRSPKSESGNADARWLLRSRDLERAVALARGSRVELEDLSAEIRQALPKLEPAAGTARPLGNSLL